MSDPFYIDSFHITLRLVLSLMLGGLIGFERERSSHAAGLRTHILVCLGSTLIMLLSMYGFSEFAKLDNVRLDPARLAAQVISGIGFLGAGTILYTGKSITGLTTAASLWVVAAIGLATGAGFYYASALVCFLALLSLWVLNEVEKRYFHGKKLRLLRIRADERPGLLTRISTSLSEQGHDIQKLTVEEHEGEFNSMIVSLTVRLGRGKPITSLVEQLQHLEGVHAISIE
ncbi:MgtC/SapB family protein [Paenibacillus sp. RC67]|uniref:MgtC/SapB family protein n=1 Tax=Paenibacillus sp. RC67 TaxID=3039392 RepID=UPI0024AE198B|nr:MgtC/SapB family protein [Paenibacillus sp. RC67]